MKLSYWYSDPPLAPYSGTLQRLGAARNYAGRCGTPLRVYRAIYTDADAKVKEQAISSGSGSDSGYSLQSYKTSMGIAEAVIT